MATGSGFELLSTFISITASGLDEMNADIDQNLSRLDQELNRSREISIDIGEASERLEDFGERTRRIFELFRNGELTTEGLRAAMGSLVEDAGSLTNAVLGAVNALEESADTEILREAIQRAQRDLRTLSNQQVNIEANVTVNADSINDVVDDVQDGFEDINLDSLRDQIGNTFDTLTDAVSRIQGNVSFNDLRREISQVDDLIGNWSFSLSNVLRGVTGVSTAIGALNRANQIYNDQLEQISAELEQQRQTLGITVQERRNELALMAEQLDISRQLSTQSGLPNTIGPNALQRGIFGAVQGLFVTEESLAEENAAIQAQQGLLEGLTVAKERDISVDGRRAETIRQLNQLASTPPQGQAEVNRRQPVIEGLQRELELLDQADDADRRRRQDNDELFRQQERNRRQQESAQQAERDLNQIIAREEREAAQQAELNQRDITRAFREAGDIRERQARERRREIEQAERDEQRAAERRERDLSRLNRQLESSIQRERNIERQQQRDASAALSQTNSFAALRGGLSFGNASFNLDNSRLEIEAARQTQILNDIRQISDSTATAINQLRQAADSGGITFC